MDRKFVLKIRVHIFTLIFLVLFSAVSNSQDMRIIPETIMPKKMVNDIVNEISGTLVYNHIIEIAGYNHNRKQEEYQGLYFESEYIIKRAEEYGFSDVHVEHFQQGRNQWDAEIGELWLVTPEEKLLISYRDVPACLAQGSETVDLSADLVYVGSGLDSSEYLNNEVEGKIVLASGSAGRVYRLANGFGAVGVVGYGQSRGVDYPDQIVWTRIRVQPGASAKFAFTIPTRLGNELAQILNREKNVKVRANVKTTYYKSDSEVPTALIPGNGTSDQEVVLCGHLFEGIAKQGALDNISGCAAILEAGRALIKLIEQGKIERPKRSIRFLWIPEMSGTREYLRRYPEEVKKIIAAINLDMVGEDVKKNHNSLVLYRSVDSRGSFLNDICQELFEYVGITNRERVHDRGWTKMLNPIFDPNGSRDPFYYNIERYYGSSDHIVFLDREFGIPAVMFNNWPDMFYHSNEDRPDKADPTQLKRAVFLALASAYVIADAGADNTQKILALIFGKANVRIMKDLEKGLKYLQMSYPYQLRERYKEVKNNIHAAYIREIINIESIKVLAESDVVAEEEISNIKNILVNSEKETQSKVTELYKMMCERYGQDADVPRLTEDEPYASNITPVSNEKDSKSGSGASGRGGSRRLSQFSRLELMNFIDSGLSILDIQNSISSQFGMVEIKDVIDFYKNLEERGLIELIRK